MQKNHLLLLKTKNIPQVPSSAQLTIKITPPSQVSKKKWKKLVVDFDVITNTVWHTVRDC